MRYIERLPPPVRLGGVALLLGVLYAGLGSLLTAEEGSAGKVGQADVNNVDVGKVVSAYAVLGREVVSADKQPLGVVVDAAIDLDDARIAVLAVGKEKDTKADKEHVWPVWIVPAKLLPKLSADKNASTNAIALTGPLPKEARVEAADWRSSVDRPWMEKTLGQKDKTAGNQPPVYKDFAWVSTLQGAPVTYLKRETLGTIIDVALKRHPLGVAYIVLSPADPDEQVAGAWGVPLSAFVVSPREKPSVWRLELPAGRLAVIPKLDPRYLPDKVDRAWEEFVSVAYGDAIDDGAQPELRAK